MRIRDVLKAKELNIPVSYLPKAGHFYSIEVSCSSCEMIRDSRNNPFTNCTWEILQIKPFQKVFLVYLSRWSSPGKAQKIYILSKMNNRLCGFQQIEIILKSFYKNSIKTASNSEGNKRYSINNDCYQGQRDGWFRSKSTDCSSKKSPEFKSLQTQVGS